MKTARIVALITLGFLGLTAMIGGIPLVIDPSGRVLHMPLALLQHSPFQTFLIPGIVLFSANGLLSLAVLAAAARRVTGYAFWIALQGFVIGGWITAQVILLRTVVWVHWVYWAVGAVLVVCGIALRAERGSLSRDSVLRS